MGSRCQLETCSGEDSSMIFPSNALAAPCTVAVRSKRHNTSETRTAASRSERSSQGRIRCSLCQCQVLQDQAVCSGGAWQIVGAMQQQRTFVLSDSHHRQGSVS